MENFSPAIQYGLLYGSIFSLFMSVLVFGTLWVNPEMWLDSAPAGAQEKLGQMSERAKKQKRSFAVVMLLGVVAIFTIALLHFRQAQGALDFLPVLVLIFVLVMVWNVVDLLIIDWLIITFWQPGFVRIRGIETSRGSETYLHHLRGFFIGIGYSVILGMLVAGAASWMG